MGWVIVSVLLGLILLEIVTRTVIVRWVLPILEEKPYLGVQEADPDLRGERINFPSRDGLTLRGSLFRQLDRPSRGLILFCPELKGNHWSVVKYLDALWQAGFELLAIDFRNQGDSDDKPGYNPMHWITEPEIQDIEAALDYIRSQDDLNSQPLGIFGVSRGGTAALIAAARHPEIQRVATDSSFGMDDMMEWYTRHWARLYVPQWVHTLFPRSHIRSTLALARIVSGFRTGHHYCAVSRALKRLRKRKKPVLMISGTRDTYVKPEIIDNMAKQIGSSCEVWMVQGARHNAARGVQPAEYDSRLIDFFSSLRSDLQTPHLRSKPARELENLIPH